MTLLRRSPALRLVLVTVLALLPARTGAQQDTSFVPTPTLLKRIAEALDGNRTGQRVWVVASRDSLNPVRGVLTDRDQALALARRLGPRYGAFGPYQTAREPQSAMIVIGCQHDGLHSVFAPRCPGGLLPALEVDSMTLVLHRRGGGTQRTSISSGVDAIFLTLPAIDKFAIPYYARVLGLDAAAAMRADIVRGIERQTPSLTPAGARPGTSP